MKVILILALVFLGCVIVVKSFLPFVLSNSCKGNTSKCNKEELEYLSIAELHDQIDDDKNGNIDITESEDYVEEALSFSGGTEKAKKFHKDDAQIDKQDLWHIWRTSEVNNWTTSDLLAWLSDEVELPQYIDSFTILKLNGSSLPRLTGNNYLEDIVKISNSIHRKKIMIKAVDAVLFGPTKKFQLSKKWILIWLTIFTMIIIYCFVQSLYSKQYVKDMQKKLDNLGETEMSLSELRDRMKEAEEFKQKTFNEIQEMEERHRFELSSAKNSSRDSLLSETDKLHDAYKEIAKLKATLVEYQRQIHKLTCNHSSHPVIPSDQNDGHLLQSLLQLTYATERQYLTEKISAIDRQSMEFKEMNEKVKKKKSGFMGSFRLVHTSDLDELEKGFAATKNAYENLIYDKNEQEARWAKLESITGLNILQCGDLGHVKQVLRWSANSPNTQAGALSSASVNHQNNENLEDFNQQSSRSTEETTSLSSESSIRSNQNISMDSVDNITAVLNHNQTTEVNEVSKRSRKDFSDRRRPLFGTGRTRIASLTRSTKK